MARGELRGRVGRVPERGQEGLRGEHVGVAAGVDLGRRPVELVDGGVVGREGADVGRVGGDVGLGLGFEVEGFAAGDDVLDHGEPAVLDGGDVGLGYLAGAEFLKVDAGDDLEVSVGGWV